MAKKTIKFFVPTRPKGKARARVTKWGAYTPKTTKDAENEFILLSKPFLPKKPIEGAVTLDLAFKMPCQAHMSKKTKAEQQGTPHINKPDIDNLAKLVMDAMSKAGFWKDDNQVVMLTASKVWAGNDDCGISVVVR